MDTRRWWDIAFPATTVVLVAVLLLMGPEPAELATGICVLLMLDAAWFLLGRRARGGPTAVSVGFLVAVVLLSGAATAVNPTLATVQCIAFPAVWVHANSDRAAILANVGVALAVFAGFVVNGGWGGGNLILGGVTEGLSFAFSMVLGFWISAISARSEERRELIEQLRASQDQVAALSRENGGAAERERLAREIHDTIAQSLTGLVLGVQRARRELAAGDSTAVARSLESLEDGTREALVETRSLVAGTARPDLPDAGVAAALTRLGQRFARETGIPVQVTADDHLDLPREVEVVLLRCTQEALANVRKHARAAAVDVAVHARDGVVALRVRDDGVGFDPELRGLGFGLTGMRERLALVSGSLTITSGPGGTELVATLPVAVRV